MPVCFFLQVFRCYQQVYDFYLLSHFILSGKCLSGKMTLRETLSGIVHFGKVISLGNVFSNNVLLGKVIFWEMTVNPLTFLLNIFTPVRC